MLLNHRPPIPNRLNSQPKRLAKPARQCMTQPFWLAHQAFWYVEVMISLLSHVQKKKLIVCSCPILTESSELSTTNTSRDASFKRAGQCTTQSF